MSRIQQLFSEYTESHQHKINKIIHWFCVPLIFFSIYGMVRAIPVPDVFYTVSVHFNWANILLLLALAYYLFLSALLFLGFIVWALIVCFGNTLLLHQFGRNDLFWISLAIFIFAWVGQFIGHSIEGKKPSFLKDLQFLLIGPAWLMNFLLKVVVPN